MIGFFSGLWGKIAGAITVIGIAVAALARVKARSRQEGRDQVIRETERRVLENVEKAKRAVDDYRAADPVERERVQGKWERRS